MPLPFILHNQTDEPSNDQSSPQFKNFTGDSYSDEETESVQDTEMHNNMDSF
ncbi:16372_t:CDS:2 [Gigaspora margarita]|uniref:16372_t:CDS:1 n=1 Tax=Gigaspora margarita TaxID=4874 RepID=A0ABM8W3D3_GIGMA|nr:16372_t:CDS:2 [Gigaspora margarita]